MKAHNGMFKNLPLSTTTTTVKTRSQFKGLESSASLDLPMKQDIASKQPSNNVFSSQSYKGFYTWLSSPKTLKMDNIAVIAPTQHHT